MFGLYAISSQAGWLLLIGAVYLLVNLGYYLALKRVALVDVMLVGGGYVLRVVAGAVAVGAVAVAVRCDCGWRAVHRRGPALRRGAAGGQLLILSATATLVSYTLYAVEADNLPDNNTMLLTVPLVIFGLFRYLYLLNHSNDAESPKLLMLRDLPLLVAIVAWIVVAGAVLVLNSRVCFSRFEGVYQFTNVALPSCRKH